MRRLRAPTPLLQLLPQLFTRADDTGVTFHEERAPSREEVAGIAARIAKRMTRWLRRRGLVDERPPEDRSNEAPELSPIEACMQLSLFGGTFLRLADDGTPVSLDEERFRIGARSPWAAEVSGFNVHAGVTVRACNREGLEKLCRYSLRGRVPGSGSGGASSTRRRAVITSSRSRSTTSRPSAATGRSWSAPSRRTSSSSHRASAPTCWSRTMGMLHLAP